MIKSEKKSQYRTTITQQLSLYVKVARLVHSYPPGWSQHVGADIHRLRSKLQPIRPVKLQDLMGLSTFRRKTVVSGLDNLAMNKFEIFKLLHLLNPI